MKDIILGFATTAALISISGSLSAQSVPNCPPGTNPQSTSHQICIGKGPVSACYTYKSQICTPPPPPPPPSPLRR